MTQDFLNISGSNTYTSARDDGTGKPVTDVNIKNGYNETDGMYKVQSLQKKFKDSFTTPTLDDSKWDILTLNGTGSSITQSNGELVLDLGMVSGSEIIIQTKETFTDPFRALLGVMFTGLPTGQEWFYEAVSVDANGTPDGQHSCGYRWRLRTDHATYNYYASYYSSNGGRAPLFTGPVSFGSGTPWSAYHIWELELFADEVWYHTRVMDSSNGRSTSFVRHRQLPDPNATFKIRLRGVNTSTPSVACTMKAEFLTIVDYAELTAEITAGRGNISAGQAMGVNIAGGTLPTVSTVSTVSTAYIAPKIAFKSETVANIPVATPFVGTVNDIGATPLYGWYRLRIFSDQPLKIEVYAGSVATLTSNRIQETINVPANTMQIVDVPIVARYIGIKATNTGVATTTAVEVLSALVSNR